MKKIQNLVDLKVKFAETEKRFNETQDAAEARDLGKALEVLKAAIKEAEAELEADKKEDEPEAVKAPAGEEARSKMDVMKAYNVSNAEVDSRSTMEYRSAFKDYVQKGIIADNLQFRNNQTGKVIEARAAGPMTSADLGVLLPTTIVQEIIKDVEKSYGQLYSRVKKLSVAGGVKFPVGSFSATFKRLGETAGASDAEKAGSVSSFVEFTYKLGEVRVSQTLIESILTVPAFEAEVARTIVEAYISGMEAEILNGDGSANQCEGILKNVSKIPESNIIELNENDMKDWKAIQKKLFAKVPLAMRKYSPEFAVTLGTYEGNFKALADDNNRPVAKETFNPVDGTETATFNNKAVYFVEEGLGFKNFDEASTDEYFGMYWVPEKAYAVNSNLEFATKRYFDENTLQWVQRAIVINDGKILDPKYIFLLKKSVTA